MRRADRADRSVWRQPRDAEDAGNASEAGPQAAARKRRFSDPGRSYAKRLERYRPGLVRYVLDALAGLYGREAWSGGSTRRRELILTILTQNSADTNAELAFEALRRGVSDRRLRPRAPARPGWGGIGLSEAPPPDWAAVETAPLAELIEAIRPGGLAVQKAPRIQAALRTIREERGDYSLEFLADMSALEARDWLTGIDGIGKKTASVCSCSASVMPLCRSTGTSSGSPGASGSSRRRRPPMTPTTCSSALLQPDQMYEAHVNLIQHGRQDLPRPAPRARALPAPCHAAGSSTRRRPRRHRRCLYSGPC